jgi:hypothetical protein
MLPHRVFIFGRRRPQRRRVQCRVTTDVEHRSRQKFDRIEIISTDKKYLRATKNNLLPEKISA